MDSRSPTPSSSHTAPPSNATDGTTATPAAPLLRRRDQAWIAAWYLVLVSVVSSATAAVGSVERWVGARMSPFWLALLTPCYLPVLGAATTLLLRATVARWRWLPELAGGAVAVGVLVFVQATVQHALTQSASTGLFAASAQLRDVAQVMAAAYSGVALVLALRHLARLRAVSRRLTLHEAAE